MKKQPAKFYLRLNDCWSRLIYLWIPWRSSSKYAPMMIIAMEPVLLMKVSALPGLPPMYNPQPTTPKMPPGINGHQTKRVVITREKTVISIQPSANHTNMMPV